MSPARAVPTTSSGNPYIDGILTENHWSDDRPGPSTQLAFYVVGDDGRTEPFRFGLDDVSGLTNPAEEQAFRLSMQLMSDVCGLSFREVSSQETADLLVGAGPAPGFEGALGFASTPGGDATGVKINSDNFATDDLSSLRQGGYDQLTVQHELGHALGLKHPWSDAGFPPFPGVSGPGDFGDNNLNQGIYSIMGYDDGFPQRDGPGDTSRIEGWTGTPMAFDVAALQYLYGANTSTRTGNTTYTLTDGTKEEFYSCIWDAGGTDTVVAKGEIDASIDLRAATLKNEPGGGGRLSAHQDVKGGFTIAKGAVIENAQGGAGDDVITGNAGNNVLAGGGGNDTLKGLGGADTLKGEVGDDRLIGGSGADSLIGGAGADRFVFTQVSDSGSKGNDRISGWESRDTIDLSGLDNTVPADLRLMDKANLTGAAGEVWVEQNFGVTQVFAFTDDKAGVDFGIVINGLVTLTTDDLIL